PWLVPLRYEGVTVRAPAPRTSLSASRPGASAPGAAATVVGDEAAAGDRFPPGTLVSVGPARTRPGTYPSTTEAPFRPEVPKCISRPVPTVGATTTDSCG